MRRATAGASAIVRLAAFKIPRCDNALDTLLVNAHGTESLLKAAAAAGRRLVFTSTSDVLRQEPRPPFAGTDDLYLGETKVEALGLRHVEDPRRAPLLRLPAGARGAGGHRAAVRLLRPRPEPHVVGGRNRCSSTPPSGTEPMDVHGDGQQTRSFTYVDDTVDGIVRSALLGACVGRDLQHRQREAGDDQALAELVWRLAGTEAEDPARLLPGLRTLRGRRNRAPEIGKAREVLGFDARIGLEERPAPHDRLAALRDGRARGSLP